MISYHGYDLDNYVTIPTVNKSSSDSKVKTLKKLFGKNHMCQGFDIWCATLSSDLLLGLLKLCPWSKNWLHCGDLFAFRRFLMEKLNNKLAKTVWTLAQILFMHNFIWWSSIKTVQIMLLGSILTLWFIFSSNIRTYSENQLIGGCVVLRLSLYIK